MVLLRRQSRLAHPDRHPGHGSVAAKLPPEAKILRTCSTGYGETPAEVRLLPGRGEVETIAHYQAAAFFDPEVDCILDIGGQDMKCIKIRNHSVDTILLNEACSSGCGSFLENFANSLGYTAAVRPGGSLCLQSHRFGHPLHRIYELQREAGSEGGASSRTFPPVLPTRHQKRPCIR